MNYASAYVIGLTPFHLLDIESSLFWVNNFTDTAVLISRITHGFHNLYDVSLIPDLETAKDIVKQIQQRYDEIAVYNNNILETVIEGTNDFDPNKLHIYEVNIGMEVT